MLIEGAAVKVVCALQGAAVRVELLLQGIAAGCCFRVLSEGGVRSGAGMLVPLQLGCCFRVLLLEWCVCALELACWCRFGAAAKKAVCILGIWVLLQGAAARVRCAV